MSRSASTRRRFPARTRADCSKTTTTSSTGRVMLYDALAMRFRELKLRKNPECPVCGAHPTVTKLIDYQQFCGIPQHEPAPAPGVAEGEIDPVEVKAKIDRGDRFVLIDVRE